METSALFDPTFWESAWKEASVTDQAREQDKKAVEVWNRRAKSYDKNVGTDPGNRRVEETLAFLDGYGILNKKLRILDLGCGPGNFSVALAERGHEVVALDPAEKMLDMVEKKLAGQPALKDLVKPVLADWVPLSLEQFGWDGYFDLVFASMTPGVRDVLTLQKVMRASRQYVYLSRFAGPRTQPSVEAIWARFQSKSYYSQSLDILFPQNWLYASGYRPAMHFARWEREHRQTMAEAIEDIRNVLALRMHMDEAVEEAIRAYVENNLDKDGLFCEVKGATSAMMLWHMENKVLTRTGG